MQSIAWELCNYFVWPCVYSFPNAIISNDIFYVFCHFCDFLLPFQVQCVMFVIILSSTKHFFFKRKLIIYYLFVLFYLNKIVTHQVLCCIYNLSHVSKLIDTCMVLKQTNRRICLAYSFPKIFIFTQLFENLPFMIFQGSCKFLGLQ